MAHTESPSPETEYRNRLSGHEQSFVKLDRQHRAYGNSKVALFLAVIGISWLSFGEALFSPFWILAPAGAMLVMVVLHEKVIVKRARAMRAIRLYKDSIERLLGNWAGRGSSGSRFRSGDHPYSEDLDIFGYSSLFELLCSARTRAGEDRLDRWLKSASNVDEVRARQVAVEELKRKLNLREDIALLGAVTEEFG